MKVGPRVVEVGPTRVKAVGEKAGLEVVKGVRVVVVLPEVEVAPEEGLAPEVELVREEVIDEVGGSSHQE